MSSSFLTRARSGSKRETQPKIMWVQRGSGDERHPAVVNQLGRRRRRRRNHPDVVCAWPRS